jgi:HEAT repeat protein
MALFDRTRKNVDRLRQENDIPGLIQVLGTDDPVLRIDAAKALCSIGVPAIPDVARVLEKTAPQARKRMLEALAAAGSQAIPLFLALIIQARPDHRKAIADSLGGMGRETFDALLPAVHHNRPAIRRGAVVALQGMGKKAIPPLLEALRDPDPAVRKEAATSLSVLQWSPDETADRATFYFLIEDWDELAKLQKGAVPVLITGLDAADARIRRESARTLGRVRDPAAVPALIRAIRDPHIEVRMGVIESLGAIRDGRACPAVIGALEDPHHHVQMEAAWALDRLGWTPQNDLQAARYFIAKEQWGDLVKMGRSAVQPLILALLEEQSGVRSGATEALRQMGAPAFEALQRAARSKNPALNKQARIALQTIQKQREAESKSRPEPVDSTKYDQELKDGLAAQKRFERHVGRPNYAQGQPVRSRPSTTQKEEKLTEAERDAAQTKPGMHDPAYSDLKELLKESRQSGEAGKEMKERLQPIVSAPAASISLDQLIPADFEQAITDIDEVRSVADPEAPQNEQETIEDLLEAGERHREPVEPADPIPEKTPLGRYLEALRSSDESIRTAAVTALQAMGEVAVDHLILALEDTHYSVRIAAAEALGEIGDAKAVNSLIGRVSDPDQEVRIAVARALGTIGDTRAIAPLIRLFGDGYYGVRFAAADAVAAFGERALGPLEKALADPSSAVRVTAVRVIGIVGDLKSIPLLVNYLGDATAEVRWSVSQALGEYGAPAVPPLVLVLEMGEKNERLSAVDALCKISGEEANEGLLHALRDEDRDVRERASAALRKEQVLDVWRKALGNQAEIEERVPKKKKKVVQEDKELFEKSGKQEIDALISALKENTWTAQVGAATRLIMMGRPAVEGLIRALKHESLEIQVAAAGILGKMRETAVEPLMDALNDEDRFIRIVAARNLGKIGNRRSIEGMIESLQREKDDEVRAVVAEALGYMGNKQAIEPLALAMRDRSETVQIAAARSLGYLGDPRAIEPLTQALSDVADRVRHAALEALKDPDNELTGHLIEALVHAEPKYKAGVADALDALGWEPENGMERTYYLIARDRWAEVERVGAEAIPTLADILADPSVELRLNAVRTIARIGGIDAVAPLVRALQDDQPVVRRRAEQALVEMGDVATDALTDAIADEESGVNETLERIIDEIRRRSSESESRDAAAEEGEEADDREDEKEMGTE